MEFSELQFVMTLQQVPNLGDATAKKLLSHAGSAEGVFKGKLRNLMKIDGVGQGRLKELNEPGHLRAAEKEMEFIQQHEIRKSSAHGTSFCENW